MPDSVDLMFDDDEDDVDNEENGEDNPGEREEESGNVSSWFVVLKSFSCEGEENRKEEEEGEECRLFSSRYVVPTFVFCDNDE